jgi:hypothetical protein
MISRMFFAALGAIAVIESLGCAGSGVSTPPVPTGSSPSAPSPPPPQTFSQARGYVEDTASRGIADATVEVLTGPQLGLTGTTASNGFFSLAGPFDTTTQFRATKNGYLTGTGSIMRPNDSYPVNIIVRLEPQGGSLDLAGRYTLTVTVDSACQFPEKLRTRSYDAQVAKPSRPGSFIANLSGAALDAYYRFILMEVAGNYVWFDLSDNYVLEEVADDAYFAIGGVGGGEATRSMDGKSISADFAGGSIEYCVTKADVDGHYSCDLSEAIDHAICTSQHNRVTLTMR